jgi:hypothetical protein
MPPYIYLVIGMLLGILIDAGVLRRLEIRRRISGENRLVLGRAGDWLKDVHGRARRATLLFQRGTLTFSSHFKGLALIYALLMVGLGLSPALQPVLGWRSWAMTAAGLLLFLLFQKGIAGEGREKALPAAPPGRRPRLKDWRISAGLASLLLVFLAGGAAGYDPRMIAPALAVPAWILSIGLLFAAGGPDGFPRPALNRRTLLLVALVAGLALLIRGAYRGTRDRWV